MAKKFFTERLGVIMRPEARPQYEVPGQVREGLVTNLVNSARLYLQNESEQRDFWRNVYDEFFRIPSIRRSRQYYAAIRDSDFFGRINLRRVPDELRDVTKDCEWHVFYDVVEVCASVVSNFPLLRISNHAREFGEHFEALLLENGVQWTLKRGKIERRRPEPVATAIENTLDVLKRPGFEGPNAQFQKAFRALDQRPEPDVENCVKDAVGALEGTAQTLAGKQGASLKAILESAPLRSKIHPTLRDALLKVEAYRGDAPGAGHANIAGKLKVEIEDAEFVLTTCAAGILFLMGKSQEMP